MGFHPKEPHFMVTSWDFNNKNGGFMGYIPSKHGDFMGFQ